MEEIHLTFSQKRFVCETLKILKIFAPNIEEKINEKLKEIKRLNKDKFYKGRLFFAFIFSLHYPVLSKKLEILKKYKIKKSLEFDEDELPFNEEIKKILNEL